MKDVTDFFVYMCVYMFVYIYIYIYIYINYACVCVCACACGGRSHHVCSPVGLFPKEIMYAEATRATLSWPQGNLSSRTIISRPRLHNYCRAFAQEENMGSILLTDTYVPWG